MLWDPWRGGGLKAACACNAHIGGGLDPEDFAHHLLLHVGTFLPGHNRKSSPVTVPFSHFSGTSDAQSR